MTEGDIWEEELNTKPSKINLLQDEKDRCDTTGKIKKNSESQALTDTILQKSGIIYLIRNKITGSKYIGQTIQSLRVRWNDHVRNAFGKVYRTPLYAAIRKRGIDSFTIECLETVYENDEISLANKLNEREIYFIKIHNTFISNNPETGYNLTTGGGNCRFSEETKQKLCRIQKSLWNDKRRQEQSIRTKSYWNSESYRKIHRESMKESFTEGTRKKLSDRSKKLWENEEYRNKMSVLRKDMFNHNESYRHNLIRSGTRNGRYDKTIHLFKNVKLNETFSGTQFEFTENFGFNRTCVNGLVRGRSEQYRGWTVSK